MSERYGLKLKNKTKECPKNYITFYNSKHTKKIGIKNWPVINFLLSAELYLPLPHRIYFT